MINRECKLPADISLIILGPRQTGKSTFLKSSFTSLQTWAVDLLDGRLAKKYHLDPGQFSVDAKYQISEKKVSHIWIDEIQKIPELLDEVHGLIEKYPNCTFVLSGSSARKLKEQGANLLGGRAAIFRMYPFIYKELKDHSFDFKERLQNGTICGLFGKSLPTQKRKLRAYVETYIKDELLAEGIIRNLPPFHRFLDLAATYATEILNYSNIAREAHISENTLKNYFQILEETFIGHFLPAFDVSVKRSLSVHPKFYFFDNGVTNAIAERLNDPLAPQVAGKLFEQWLINEIKAHIAYSEKERSLYFWRTTQGHEVDLLITRSHIPQLAIEFKYKSSLSKDDFMGINKLHEDYPELPTWIVTNVTSPYLQENILILPWKEFLLEYLYKI